MLDTRDKFKSSVGFTDLLFNMLVGFVFLFIVAFILINPITKKSDAPKKAEYLIIIEWPAQYNDDVDLYVKDPRNATVSFRQKMGGLLNLEKDDLGFSNDTWIDADGQQHVIPLNREVVTVRGVQDGRYQVAAHIYSVKSVGSAEAAALVTGDRVITATLIKLNPYREIMKVQVPYRGERGQVLTLFNFTIDGKHITVDTDANSIVLVGSRSYNEPAATGGVPRPTPLRTPSSYLADRMIEATTTRRNTPPADHLYDGP